jgi:glycosyltransferase involved in cell wall biosynthesis
MLVSVAIPAYNEESILERCLRSLKAQTVKCEIIVCDNNSTDRTHQIAEKYADKVVKERKQGVAHTFNAACKAARGELIALTGADCVVQNDWIEKFIPHFKDKKTVACFGPVHALEKEHRGIFKAYSMFDRMLVMIKLPWGVSDANLMVRKSVLQRVNYFDPDVQMLEDSLLMKKMKRYGKIKFLKNNIVKTSVRRIEQEGVKKVFIDRLVAMLRLKIFQKVGVERFETVR